MSERKVKLPGFPAVTESNLAQVVRLLVERAEVREGARGADLEAVVTRRDLVDMGLPVSGYPARGGFGNSGGAGVMVQSASGGLTAVSIEAFSESLRNSKLYSSLTKRLDDVSRFDDVPDAVRKLVEGSIADKAAIIGADVQRVDYKLQSATESIAYAMQEVTAAVANASAGVREVTYASATANQATAGKITQIQARLDDVGGVTIEESLTATADRVDGLAGEYTVKINAGGAVAGFGLAASEDPTGATESSFIVQADKFAVMMPGLANAIPFGVDASGVYINGGLRVNAGGATIADSVGKYTDYIFRRSATVLGTAPTGDNPAGWSDTPPSGTDPLYMAVADKTAGGALIGVWSTPVRLDGTNGTGIAGQYTESQYGANSSSTSSAGVTFTSTQPTLSTGQFMWMQVRTVTPPTAPGAWGTAVRISGEKGNPGADSTVPGTPGTRGTIVTKMTGAGTAANAAAAIAAITSVTLALPATPIKGDIVSHPGGAIECTAAGNPGSWGNVVAYFNGNMVITGTAVADSIRAGTVDIVSTLHIQGNAVTIPIYRNGVGHNLYGLTPGNDTGDYYIYYGNTAPLVQNDVGVSSAVVVTVTESTTFLLDAQMSLAGLDYASEVRIKLWQNSALIKTQAYTVLPYGRHFFGAKISVTLAASVTPYYFEMQVENPTSVTSGQGVIYLREWNLTVLGVKR